MQTYRGPWPNEWGCLNSCVNFLWHIYTSLFWHIYRSLLTYIQVSLHTCKSSLYKKNWVTNHSHVSFDMYVGLFYSDLQKPLVQWIKVPCFIHVNLLWHIYISLIWHKYGSLLKHITIFFTKKSMIHMYFYISVGICAGLFMRTYRNPWSNELCALVQCGLLCWKTKPVSICLYEVATISRLLIMIGLFCRISSVL